MTTSTSEAPEAAIRAEALRLGFDLCRFTDIPETHGPMGRFIITNLAAFAELEAGLISERTKSALAAAKARGTRLGNPRLLADASAFAAERERRLRDRFMRGIDLGAAVAEARAAGHATIKGLADELNRRGVPTPRGRRWHASTLHTALSRRKEAAIEASGGFDHDASFNNEGQSGCTIFLLNEEQEMESALSVETILDIATQPSGTDIAVLRVGALVSRKVDPL